jgi:hypothetical protein
MKRLVLLIARLIFLFSPLMSYADNTTSSVVLPPIPTQQFLMVSGLIDKNTPLENLTPFFKPEAQLAWQYYSARRAQQVYARADEMGVVILWEARNIRDAKLAIEQMPMVKANLIGYKLYPVKFFESLSSLFNTDTPTTRDVPTIAKKLQFVLIMRPAVGVVASQISPFIKDETLAIWHNYQTGFFRQMFDSADPSQIGGGVIIMTANNLNNAYNIVNALPLVKNKLVDYDLIPVRYFFPFGDLFSSH